jgi:hypothetical protein
MALTAVSLGWRRDAKRDSVIEAEVRMKRERESESTSEDGMDGWRVSE